MIKAGRTYKFVMVSGKMYTGKVKQHQDHDKMQTVEIVDKFQNNVNLINTKIESYEEVEDD